MGGQVGAVSWGCHRRGASLRAWLSGPGGASAEAPERRRGALPQKRWCRPPGHGGDSAEAGRCRPGRRGASAEAVRGSGWACDPIHGPRRATAVCSLGASAEGLALSVWWWGASAESVRLSVWSWGASVEAVRRTCRDRGPVPGPFRSWVGGAAGSWDRFRGSAWTASALGCIRSWCSSCGWRSGLEGASAEALPLCPSGRGGASAEALGRWRVEAAPARGASWSARRCDPWGRVRPSAGGAALLRSRGSVRPGHCGAASDSWRLLSAVRAWGRFCGSAGRLGAVVEALPRKRWRLDPVQVRRGLGCLTLGFRGSWTRDASHPPGSSGGARTSVPPNPPRAFRTDASRPVGVVAVAADRDLALGSPAIGPLHWGASDALPVRADQGVVVGAGIRQTPWRHRMHGCVPGGVRSPDGCERTDDVSRETSHPETGYSGSGARRLSLWFHVKHPHRHWSCQPGRAPAAPATTDA